MQKKSAFGLLFIMIFMVVVAGCSIGDNGVSTLVGVFSETHSGINLSLTPAIVNCSYSNTNAQSISEGLDGMEIKLLNAGGMGLKFVYGGSTNLSSKYSGGYLNFSIKTTSSAALKVGVGSGNTNFWVNLNSSHYTSDGKWHAVSIPLSSFAGLDLTSVNQFFLLTNTGTLTVGDTLFVDDIFWSASAVTVKPWQYVWSDEFNGASLDTTVWSYSTGAGGYGNSELQNFTTDAANSYFINGTFCIKAIYLGGNKDSVGQYTSAKIHSYNKKNFKYGRIAARIKMDVEGQGAWPAFWTLGSSMPAFNGDGTAQGWPGIGEIDIMELGLGGAFDSIGGTIHYSDANGTHQYLTATTAGSFADRFNVFEIEWTSSLIIWRLNGVAYHTESIVDDFYGEFRANQFLIFNLAIGGPNTPYTGYKSVDTTKFPKYMYIDWVRWYTN